MNETNLTPELTLEPEMNQPEVPQLTLEPVAEQQTEEQKELEEKAKLEAKRDINAVIVDEKQLTEEEKKVVDEFSKKLISKIQTLFCSMVQQHRKI